MALTAERIKDLLGLEPLMREGGHYKRPIGATRRCPTARQRAVQARMCWAEPLCTCWKTAPTRACTS